MARKVLGKKTEEFGKEKYQCIILYVNITLSILGVFVQNKLLLLVIYLHPHCGYSQHFFRPAEENPIHALCPSLTLLFENPLSHCVSKRSVCPEKVPIQTKAIWMFKASVNIKRIIFLKSLH